MSTYLATTELLLYVHRKEIKNRFKVDFLLCISSYISKYVLLLSILIDVFCLHIMLGKNIEYIKALFDYEV